MVTITIKQHESIQAMQEWDKMQEIKQMTSAEVNGLIFGDAEPWEHVSMPEYVAQAIIECDHFSVDLKEWAWDTIRAIMDSEGDD